MNVSIGKSEQSAQRIYIETEPGKYVADSEFLAQQQAQRQSQAGLEQQETAGKSVSEVIGAREKESEQASRSTMPAPQQGEFSRLKGKPSPDTGPKVQGDVSAPTKKR